MHSSTSCGRHNISVSSRLSMPAIRRRRWRMMRIQARCCLPSSTWTLSACAIFWQSRWSHYSLPAESSLLSKAISSYPILRYALPLSPPRSPPRIQDRAPLSSSISTVSSKTLPRNIPTSRYPITEHLQADIITLPLSRTTSSLPSDGQRSLCCWCSFSACGHGTPFLS